MTERTYTQADLDAAVEAALMQAAINNCYMCSSPDEWEPVTAEGTHKRIELPELNELKSVERILDLTAAASSRLALLGGNPFRNRPGSVK